MSDVVDKFGFLNSPINLHLENAKIYPLPEYDKAKDWVVANTNEDGFLYPGMSHRVTLDIHTGKTKPIPKTSRPANLFRIPASHSLSITNVGDESSVRNGFGGFIIKSLAFIYGTKLQFWDWWFEGRVPTLEYTNNIYVDCPSLEKFYGKAVPCWHRFSTPDQNRLLSLLFVSTVAGATEWDWNQFLLEYMVTDACFALACSTQRCSASTKFNSRFHALCDAYGIARNDEHFASFASLRNELFHESTWDGGWIFSRSSNRSIWAPMHLHRFNHRLVVSILYGPCEYVSSPWTSVDTSIFAIG